MNIFSLLQNKLMDIVKVLVQLFYTMQIITQQVNILFAGYVIHLAYNVSILLHMIVWNAIVTILVMNIYKKLPIQLIFLLELEIKLDFVPVNAMI